MSIKCKANDYAFYNGQNIVPDTEFFFEEEDLMPDAKGYKVLTPRWCYPLEPFETPAPKKVAAQKAPKQAKKKDIFSAV